MSPSSLELDLDPDSVRDAGADAGKGSAAAEASAAESLAPSKRKAERTMALFCVLAAVALVLLVSSGVLLQPVQVVRIKGDLLRVSKEEFVHAIQPRLTPGLLRIDMAALRLHALDIPWVRDVSIRRVWPDGLDIVVVEERPFARWESGGYIDDRGRHFFAPPSDPSDRLPALFGPPETQAMVSGIYRRLEREIAPFGLQLARIGLTPRGVFHITLRDGPHLVFPPDKKPVSRARSGIELIHREFAERLHEIERIDFRYPDGFALLPKKRSESPQGSGRGAALRFLNGSGAGDSA
ncbi:cell division protein FtsQ/DivIB [Thioalkalivibrio sp. HK1]|uniref:cell division protein FtsQ/DivIB n=1 Tax=Thioalkalivibrio sp. HK1 TaxID=1469245 RepID=UPI0004707945|nr:FtsQ-type POTRA domain-containing protein [Thioalkalivibrio sp. HK1]